MHSSQLVSKNKEVAPSPEKLGRLRLRERRHRRGRGGAVERNEATTTGGRRGFAAGWNSPRRAEGRKWLSNLYGTTDGAIASERHGAVGAVVRSVAKPSPAWDISFFPATPGFVTRNPRKIAIRGTWRKTAIAIAFPGVFLARILGRVSRFVGRNFRESRRKMRPLPRLKMAFLLSSSNIDD